MNVSQYLFMDWTPEKNCLWLVRDFYKENFGITLPNYSKHNQGLVRTKAIKDGLNSPQWVLLDTPQDLCIVAMGRKEQIIHVGIWFAKGEKILHLPEGQSGKIQSIETLKPFFKTIRFYKYEPSNSTRT